MNDACRTLLRLALAACGRGDALGAHPLVAAVLDMPDEPELAPCTPHAETYRAFGRRIGASARTVRAMVRDGRITPDSVVGTGRGRRVLVGEALSALKRPTTNAESDGMSYIARRRRAIREVGA